MELTYLLHRIRNEIGDPVQNFRDIQQGDGATTWYDLSKNRINPNGLTVTVVNNAQTTELVINTDYTVEWQLGQLTLTSPIPVNAIIIVAGSSWGMFTDWELTEYCRDAVNMHCHNRTMTERYWDRNGFIGYRETPVNFLNLPQIEEPMLVTLVTLNIFYSMANDAVTDTDIQTAEGTNLNRAQRYRQLMEQIQLLDAKYKDWCAQLNIGFFRWEVLELRRVSKTTNRLVPVYVDREFDDHSYPVREILPVDKRYVDNSGIPSQLFQGYY